MIIISTNNFDENGFIQLRENSDSIFPLFRRNVQVLETLDGDAFSDDRGATYANEEIRIHVQYEKQLFKDLKLFVRTNAVFNCSTFFGKFEVVPENLEASGNEIILSLIILKEKGIE